MPSASSSTSSKSRIPSPPSRLARDVAPPTGLVPMARGENGSGLAHHQPSGRKLVGTTFDRRIGCNSMTRASLRAGEERMGAMPKGAWPEALIGVQGIGFVLRTSSGRDAAWVVVRAGSALSPASSRIRAAPPPQVAIGMCRMDSGVFAHGPPNSAPPPKGHVPDVLASRCLRRLAPNAARRSRPAFVAVAQ
eukprot:scaffold24564_cov30-Tisochrysis_lutea.AAC.8